MCLNDVPRMMSLLLHFAHPILRYGQLLAKYAYIHIVVVVNREWASPAASENQIFFPLAKFIQLWQKGETGSARDGTP